AGQCFGSCHTVIAAENVQRSTLNSETFASRLSNRTSRSGVLGLRAFRNPNHDSHDGCRRSAAASFALRRSTIARRCGEGMGMESSARVENQYCRSLSILREGLRKTCNVTSWCVKGKIDVWIGWPDVDLAGGSIHRPGQRLV